MASKYYRPVAVLVLNDGNYPPPRKCASNTAPLPLMIVNIYYVNGSYYVGGPSASSATGVKFNNRTRSLYQHIPDRYEIDDGRVEAFSWNGLIHRSHQKDTLLSIDALIKRLNAHKLVNAKLFQNHLQQFLADPDEAKDGCDRLYEANRTMTCNEDVLEIVKSLAHQQSSSSSSSLSSSSFNKLSSSSIPSSKRGGRIIGLKQSRSKKRESKRVASSSSPSSSSSSQSSRSSLKRSNSTVAVPSSSSCSLSALSSFLPPLPRLPPPNINNNNNSNGVTIAAGAPTPRPQSQSPQPQVIPTSLLPHRVGQSASSSSLLSSSFSNGISTMKANTTHNNNPVNNLPDSIDEYDFFPLEIVSHEIPSKLSSSTCSSMAWPSSISSMNGIASLSTPLSTPLASHVSSSIYHPNHALNGDMTNGDIDIRSPSSSDYSDYYDDHIQSHSSVEWGPFQ